MTGTEFLILIRESLDKAGHAQLVGGLKETQQTVQQLAETKVTVFTDKEGLVTGAKLQQTIGGIADTTKKTTPIMEQMGLAMSRALIVAPVWMIMRASIQAVIKPVQELIKAFFELDAGLAKVMTVTRIATSEQSKFYGQLTQAAWKYYQTSSASMKDITEAMYQIGTAGRSTTEILNGFNHVLDLSIATFGDIKAAGRVTTGILNVFGDSMTDLITAEEKMRYISDLLVYTWSKHQVELDEISTAIGYVGAAADSLDIDLKTIVGTIGFLNDGLLRGSKAGTSLLNTFIQLAKSPEKLRNLGVAFDPSKPLDLVDIMQQLHNRFLETGKTIDFTSDLFDVFGNRGGRAVSLIVQNFDRWIKSIKQGDKEFTNFAEHTKEIAEKTLPKAFIKFFKLALLPPPGVAGGTNFLTEFFNNQSKQIQENIDNLKIYRDLVERGFNLPRLPSAGREGAGEEEIKIPKELVKQLEPLKEFFELIGETEIFAALNKGIEESSTNIGTAAEQVKKLFDESAKAGIEWDKINIKTKNEILNLLGVNKENITAVNYLGQIYNYRQKNLQVIKEEVNQNKGLTSELKTRLEQIDLETKYSLMKIAGAQEEEIAYSEITDKVKQLNDLAEKSNELRKKEGKELYSMISVTDVINGNWQKIISSGTTVLDKEKDIIKFEKLRVQIISARLDKLAQEKKVMQNLIFQYKDADMFEKSRIRRQIELTAMTPEQVVESYKESPYNQKIILDNIGSFSQEVADSIAKLEAVNLGMSDYTKVLAALEAGKTEVRGTPIEQQVAPITNITGAGVINVNVAAGGIGTAEEIVTLINKQMAEVLLANEDFVRPLGKKYNIEMVR